MIDVDPNYLRDQLVQMRSELVRANQEGAKLRAENAALSAHMATLVTYEADAKHVKRQAELASQTCYRCSHTASRPEKGCACCENDHTPNADGNFPESDPED